MTRRPDPPRAASNLELFFDLTFVTAVSLSTHELLASETSRDLSRLLPFTLAFFAIWWAWDSFTWFSSAFDDDSWQHRLLTLGLILGALITTGGIPALVEHGSLLQVVSGYAVMRLIQVAQWLRVSHRRPYRRTARRYAAAIGSLQVGWVGTLLLPESWAVVVVLILCLAELLVPVWAEQVAATPFHRGHLVERYGLFTLIVLGEDLVAVAGAVIAQNAREVTAQTLLFTLIALTLVAGFWWMYFTKRPDPILKPGRSMFGFSFLQFVIFVSAAAVASGLQTLLRQYQQPAVPGADPLSLVLPQDPSATWFLTVPVIVFVLATWASMLRDSATVGLNWTVFIGVGCITVASFTSAAVVVAAAAVAAIVAVLEHGRHRSGANQRMPEQRLREGG